LLPCWPLVMLCTPNHGWVLIVRAAAWRLPRVAEHDGSRVQASPSAVSVSPGHSGAGSARLAAWCFFRSCSRWPRIPFVQRSETRTYERCVLLGRITPQCSANALGGSQKRATRPKLALGAGCWSSSGSVEGAGGPFESESETLRPSVSCMTRPVYSHVPAAVATTRRSQGHSGTSIQPGGPKLFPSKSNRRHQPARNADGSMDFRYSFSKRGPPRGQ
jgi:hypothetical protein